MILAVDLGNHNTKTSEGIIFSSKYTIDKQIDKDTEDIINFDGFEYCIGKGNYDFEYDKTKKNYLPLLLTAIAKSTRDKEIDLVVGCPLEQIAKKDEFVKELENKKFNFIYNDKHYNIWINRVMVLPEGFSSFYTLPKNIREQRTLIIDIGGRTVNAASFIKGKLENKTTIGKGMQDLYNAVKEKENGNGKKLSVGEIENLIEENRIYDIEDLKINFIKDILNELKLTFDSSLYDIHFTGGGTIVLSDIIRRKLKRAYVIDNSLFSNANGNKAIAEVKWR
ncbi:MAG: hypothetical protein ACRC7S_14765 [Cetobacterium sp.]